MVSRGNKYPHRRHGLFQRSALGELSATILSRPIAVSRKQTKATAQGEDRLTWTFFSSSQFAIRSSGLGPELPTSDLDLFHLRTALGLRGSGSEGTRLLFGDQTLGQELF